MSVAAGSVVAPVHLGKNTRVLLDSDQRQRLGDELKKLRLGRNLHQEDVAREAGLSVGTLQTIESGARKNRAENIDKVARVFKTTIAVLLQKPQIDPADPLVQGLNHEDYEIARAYHEASSAVREHARQLLRDRDPQAPSEPLPGAIAALAAQIAHLSEERRNLVMNLVRQLLQVEENRRAG